MKKLSCVKIYPLEPDVEDPEYSEILLRVELVEYFDDKGEQIKNYDDSEWDGFFYWDFHTASEMIQVIAARLEVDSKIVEIAL
ncbi:hypothetical protein [Peribacillus frigoritolerans]|uniref:hypothetical protein n=1 Tax=Peribacillus frigoritolerans TaxID=450367 RepID=UPI002E22A49F|nr:hypothetical protein [Peribacillus frigoritolerans]